MPAGSACRRHDLRQEPVAAGEKNADEPPRSAPRTSRCQTSARPVSRSPAAAICAPPLIRSAPTITKRPRQSVRPHAAREQEQDVGEHVRGEDDAEVGEPVSWMTANASAIGANELPKSEIVLPAKSSRKSRLQAGFRASTGHGSCRLRAVIFPPLTLCRSEPSRFPPAGEFSTGLRRASRSGPRRWYSFPPTQVSPRQ